MAKIKRKVPIHLHSAKAEFVSFDGISDTEEHVAIIFPLANNDTPTVRLHSSCLTGDIFHSLQCDCHDQLHEAINHFAQHGGIILYLQQEGRGIGLYEKLEAYALQQDGLNTYEANEKLGHPEDARNYKVAAEMLEALDLTTIKLLTNNHDKVKQLEKNGITVKERIPTDCYVTPYNEKYLNAKAQKEKKRAS